MKEKITIKNNILYRNNNIVTVKGYSEEFKALEDNKYIEKISIDTEDSTTLCAIGIINENILKDNKQFNLLKIAINNSDNFIQGKYIIKNNILYKNDKVVTMNQEPKEFGIFDNNQYAELVLVDMYDFSTLYVIAITDSNILSNQMYLNLLEKDIIKGNAII